MALAYLLVLDFEATCSNLARIEKQEIIEFPILVYDLAINAVTATFHKYVKPVVNPTLTEFCTELTGITQATVDAAEPFPTVWSQVDNFLSHNLISSSSHTEDDPPATFAFLTCGDWDLKTMLPTQLAVSSELDSSFPAVLPPHFRRWINVKKAFAQHYRLKRQPRGMTEMLDQQGLQLEGRHHSGIDDCSNIARIVKNMREEGWVPKVTSFR